MMRTKEEESVVGSRIAMGRRDEASVVGDSEITKADGVLSPGKTTRSSGAGGASLKSED